MLSLEIICDDNKLPPVKVFFSRRNKVCLKETVIADEKMYIVIKEHPNEQMACIEVQILNNLYEKKVKVPFCYGHYKNKVVTNYLSGVLLNDLIDNFSEYNRGWITELADWYLMFHKTNMNNEGKVLLKADNNLRNFIYHQGNFFGIDFEAPIYGFPEEDLGECSAYILTNSPAFTEEKYLIVREFITAYAKLDPMLSTKKVKEEIIKNLYLLAERRPKQKHEILINLEYLKANFHI